MPAPGSIREYCLALAGRAAAIVRADGFLYGFIAIYAAAGLAFLAEVGALDRAAYHTYLPIWLLLFGFLLPSLSLLFDVGRFLHRFDRRRALAARRAFSVERMACFVSGIALLMGIMVFQSTFTSVKNGIYVLWGRFPFDRVQADLDAALHFGRDPWHWLYALGEHAWVRFLVEWNYDMLWFVICYGMLFFMVTSPRTRRQKRRYVLSFMLVWIVVGNVLAGMFLSAGPAFYGFVTGDEARFADQLAFLAQSTSSRAAMIYQHYLWTLQSAGRTGFASGISAFPSVHVAMITLNALFIAEYDRRLGAIAFAYTAFVAASSVYLAWHYAIDGYVAVAVTVVLYALVRRLAPDAPDGARAAPVSAASGRPLTVS
jgi:hypothetical protein